MSHGDACSRGDPSNPKLLSHSSLPCSPEEVVSSDVLCMKNFFSCFFNTIKSEWTFPLPSRLVAALVLIIVPAAVVVSRLWCTRCTLGAPTFFFPPFISQTGATATVAAQPAIPVQ